MENVSTFLYSKPFSGAQIYFGRTGCLCTIAPSIQNRKCITAFSGRAMQRFLLGIRVVLPQHSIFANSIPPSGDMVGLVVVLCIKERLRHHRVEKCVRRSSREERKGNEQQEKFSF